ncbi:MAG: primosomal protein N', partial [Muribaculaceae bacterium]|nr:primosomal protein N' [Muribaculaceae bacterium]
METYAQVLLPLPLNATFTYRVPHEMTDRARVGFRVIVPFGRKRFYTGIIQSLSPKAPEGFEIRDIALTLDDTPIIRHPQLKLWDWLADYYLCAPGDVYKAAVPAGLKIESETFVEVNPDFELEDGETLSEREAIIQQTLDHEGALTIDAISTKTGLKGVQAVVNRMIERGIIIISEKLVERYRAKREPYVVP